MRQNTRLQVRTRGEIVLGYRQDGAGWRLWVHDNGHGMPSETERRSAKSFGKQLVAALVTRVIAEIVYTSDSGTKVDVTCGVLTKF
jgi:two-component sensor histidine kinase